MCLAYEPDVWRDFFEKYAKKQVTCVTVALDNEKMLRKLIARRIHRNNLRLFHRHGAGAGVRLVAMGSAAGVGPQ